MFWSLDFGCRITQYLKPFCISWHDNDDDDDELFLLTDKRHLRLISSRYHCHRFSPSQFSDTYRAVFQPAQNRSSHVVEWSCAVVIITKPRRHGIMFHYLRPRNRWTVFIFIKSFFNKDPMGMMLFKTFY